MTEMDRDFYWYWFVNIEGIGNVGRVRLLERYGHPRYLYDCGRAELSDLLTERQIHSLEQSRDSSRIQRDMRRLGEERIRFVHWESPDYPPRLRNLYDPPYGFYLKGKLPDSVRPAVAIVGSRKPSQYGRKMAAVFAGELAREGVAIVSGMAAGIDSEAHRAALKVSGQTLGILGGGIDSMYPKDNWNLYLDMYEHGGIMSEYNVGTVSRSGLFPMRNRLISGISDCVLVVEAGERSGSLITADQGLEQGREIFAIPGRITDTLSRGCNHLIAQGALVAESPRVILEDIRRLYQEDHGIPPSPSSEKGCMSLTSYDTMACPSFSREEEIIMENLDEIEARSFDSLLIHTGLTLGILQHNLMHLEMRSYIFQPQQNMYLKRIRQEG